MDVVIVEIGGTVGDIESLPFLEAIRQMRHEHGRENTHLRARDAGALDRRGARAEDQAHPAQRQGAARDRYPAGHPAVPLASGSLPQEVREKIALFCDVDVDAVITARDVESVYEVPLVFAEQGVDEIVLRLMRLEAAPARPARAGPRWWSG